MAANVAIKTMGGPTITTRYGRVDAVSASESASSASGRLPEADKDEHHLRSLAMNCQTRYVETHDGSMVLVYILTLGKN